MIVTRSIFSSRVTSIMSAIKTLSLLLLCASSALAVAIDYPGGWAPSFPAKQWCVDICAGAAGRPTCPTRDPECERKAQRPGDFDYLLLEQLFLPQFCRELLIGVDPTLEHRPVAKFPSGIACRPHRVRSQLSIHGLWPNYVAGFPTCCNISDATVNRPYDPRKFTREHKALLQDMNEQWVDPTQPEGGLDALCELYNHEFQKHGLCYGADASGSYEESARIFFEATMRAAGSHSNATDMINAWAVDPEPPRRYVADVRALFPKHVQVLCSADSSFRNELGAIRTCFKQASVVGVGGDASLEPIDCGDDIASQAFIACDVSVPIKLTPYAPPPHQLQVSPLDLMAFD